VDEKRKADFVYASYVTMICWHGQWFSHGTDYIFI
jgi:hypothetical protein